MDEFENKNNELFNEPVNEASEEQPITQPVEEEPISEAEEVFEAYDKTSAESAFVPVNYTKIQPINDYKPMSRGLKAFALAMAAVLLLTVFSVGGYFIGVYRSSNSSTGQYVGLESKPADTDEMSAAQVYDQVSESVVGICIYNAEGAYSMACGVVYSEDGYIVTNDHIYSDVASPKFKVYTQNGKEYDAEYVAGDTTSDLAVLKVVSTSDKFKPAVFGNSDEVISGENVVAIAKLDAANQKASITKGVVSVPSVRVQTTSSYSANLIQTDSAINPGSSGGALVNMYGQVIGIASSKLAGVEYDDVGYAIPSVTVKRIVEELVKYGVVTTRAKLGISYSVIDSITAEREGYNVVGLQVASVSEDSDLYGIVETGDVITHVNGVEITDDDIMLDVIERCSAGDSITVKIYSQSGSYREYTVVLKANPGESSYKTDSSLSSDSSSGNGGIFDFPQGE